MDEFVGEGDHRAATPLELGKGWEARLAAATKKTPGPRDLALPAFTLIRGGDLFETQGPRAKTERALIDLFREKQLRVVANGAAAPEREGAVQGVLRVLAGNPAVCRRMLLAKPLDLVIVPKDEDFRAYGFPRETNPLAAGIFWNGPKDERALVGLREELILEKSYLPIHEMAHAVHFLGLIAKEREDIEKLLLPVYRSRRWVEEVLAIYAERAFGARYTAEDMTAPGLYGKTRREWTDRAVFSLFVKELFRP